jgi:protein-L-isoaspartate O-methyltransferase
MSDSFLVRCWKEPREVEDQPDIVRVYVRNLRTGEEHYLKEPSLVGELVERGLQQAADRAIETDTGSGYSAG